MNLYEGLHHYLTQLHKRYDVHITIKDFSGFLDADPLLYRTIQSFTIHHSCYCMTIKSHDKLWNSCLKTKDFLYERLRKNPKSFYGHCYAGIGEYVVPIHDGQRLLGAFTVGNFATEHTSKLVNKVIAKGELNQQFLAKSYEDSTSSPDTLDPKIEQDLQIISEYIVLLYQQKGRSKDRDISPSTATTSKPYILSHAIEYLNLHATKSIKLEDVASYCHCSPSYISHQFKAYTGMNMNAYINKKRIEQAKELLVQTNKSITDIAYEVGFRDSNYFSKVFKDLCKISPNRYRKSKQ